MERQSWTVRETRGFWDSLLMFHVLFRVSLPFLCIAAFLIYLGSLFTILQLTDELLDLTGFIASAGLALSFALVAPLLFGVWLLICSLPWCLFCKFLPLIVLEISADGLTRKVPSSGYEALIRWPLIRGIYRKHNYIFIKYKVSFLPQFIPISYRIFTEPAEGERFYADLNYFWEQGR